MSEGIEREVCNIIYIYIQYIHKYINIDKYRGSYIVYLCVCVCACTCIRNMYQYGPS